MSNDFDYTVVTRALIKAIKDGTGYQLIEANSPGEQPEYPFCTFTITSPSIQIERYYEGALFEMVVSLTWHGTSSVGVLNLAKKSESYLRSDAGRKTLADNGIALVDITGISSRDNFISIDYERTIGFDVRLLAKDTFTDDSVDTIESFKVNYYGG
ncbi:hypothetical protein ABEU95_12435 [Heyndrickxia faecalis]|uniref:phage neck terminator protein n=1 Tax=Heyndrickxia faecalis TaxID=2824910 RepID=UPI003D2252A1